MKAKELYERLLHVGAEIGSVLTTSALTSIDRFIEDKFSQVFKKPLEGKEKQKWSDICSDIYTDVYELGLVKGYIVGQLFDFRDPEILQNIEIIKKQLVKEGYFAFTPREKAAHPHKTLSEGL